MFKRTVHQEMRFGVVMLGITVTLIIAGCGGDNGTGTRTDNGGDPSGDSFTDTRGNKIQIYHTVTIGNQVWMAENLNYETAGSYCYNNSSDSCVKYGRLYTWSAAMGLEETYDSELWGGSDVNHQGACPAGWHLPSSQEWQTLESFVGVSTAGTKLKSKTGWSSNSGTDNYGFSALPGGFGISGGGGGNAGIYGYWWSATEDGAGARYRRMGYVGNVVEVWSDKRLGLSVRCVKD